MPVTPLRAVRKTLDIGFWALVIAFLILFALQIPHPPQLDDAEILILLHQYCDPLLTVAGSIFNLPWPTSYKSVLPVGACIVTLGIKKLVDTIFDKVQWALSSPNRQQGPGAVEGLVEVRTADSEKARQELLQRYQMIERALKKAGRKQCSFLSVDVVGSTQMKVGEEKHKVDATFRAYELMLRAILERCGAWKQAWTPDGVMVCFLDHNLAVRAGKEILQALRTNFNESENMLRTPFRVRCGLNVGEVQIFPDSDLEKVTDRVIDVAGHMQKQASPDTLWVPAEAYNRLETKAGFQPMEAIVDGYHVYQWKYDGA
jgi:class 3 adenylate cyclase